MAEFTPHIPPTLYPQTTTYLFLSFSISNPKHHLYF